MAERGAERQDRTGSRRPRQAPRAGRRTPRAKRAADGHHAAPPTTAASRSRAAARDGPDGSARAPVSWQRATSRARTPSDAPVTTAMRRPEHSSQPRTSKWTRMGARFYDGGHVGGRTEELTAGCARGSGHGDELHGRITPHRRATVALTARPAGRKSGCRRRTWAAQTRRTSTAPAEGGTPRMSK